MGGSGSKPGSKSNINCCTPHKNGWKKKKKDNANKSVAFIVNDKRSSSLVLRVANLSGPEANALRSEYDKLKVKLQEKEEENEKLKQNEEKVRKEFEQRVEGLEKEIVEIKQRHEEELKDVTSRFEHEVEERERVEAELVTSQERNSNLELNLEAMVAPKVEELMKPYVSAHEECESLKAVVDMKNEALRKLQLQVRCEQLKTKDKSVLSDHNEKLTREKEDLQARLSDKNQLILSMREEVGEERTRCREARRELQEVRSKLEQLAFKRQNNNSPIPPQSPNSSNLPNFNPVFTQSPTSKS